MTLVKMFKAQKTTSRFNLNQKVFVSHEFDSHYFIKFKWRGSGRWTTGVIRKYNNQYTKQNSIIGEIKEIEVSDNFSKFISD